MLERRLLEEFQSYLVAQLKLKLTASDISLLSTITRVHVVIFGTLGGHQTLDNFRNLAQMTIPQCMVYARFRGISFDDSGKLQPFFWNDNNLEYFNKIRLRDIQEYHAWIFDNVYQGSFMSQVLDGILKIELSDAQRLVFISFPQEQRNIHLAQFLKNQKLSDNQSGPFSMLPEHDRTIESLLEIIRLNPDEKMHMCFSVLDQNTRSIKVLKQIVILQPSTEDAVQFLRLLPGQKNLESLEYIVKPSMFKGCNIIVNEALVNSALRRKVLPFFIDSLRYYNITISDSTHSMLYAFSPYFSKVIINFAPQEVVVPAASYVLKTGLPNDIFEFSLCLTMATAPTLLIRLFPSIWPYAAVGGVVLSIATSSMLSDDSESNAEFSYNVIDDNSDVYAISSLIMSFSLYGLGCSIPISFAISMTYAVTALIENSISNFNVCVILFHIFLLRLQWGYFSITSLEKLMLLRNTSGECRHIIVVSVVNG